MTNIWDPNYTQTGGLTNRCTLHAQKCRTVVNFTSYTVNLSDSPALKIQNVINRYFEISTTYYLFYLPPSLKTYFVEIRVAWRRFHGWTALPSLCGFLGFFRLLFRCFGVV